MCFIGFFQLLKGDNNFKYLREKKLYQYQYRIYTIAAVLNIKFHFLKKKHKQNKRISKTTMLFVELSHQRKTLIDVKF